jgi:hypothetical protein
MKPTFPQESDCRFGKPERRFPLIVRLGTAMQTPKNSFQNRSQRCTLALSIRSKTYEPASHSTRNLHPCCNHVSRNGAPLSLGRSARKKCRSANC